MQIELVATDTGVVVSPWPKALESSLILERRTRASDAVLTRSGNVRNVSRKETKRIKLWHINDQLGAGIILPAMLGYVSNVLGNLGYGVQITDMRSPCTEPDWSRLSVDLRDGQPEILTVMCTERYALIKAATGLGKTEALVQFRRINPELKIGVVTFSGSVRDSIANRIQSKDPEHSVCVLKAGLRFYNADTYVLASQSLHRLDPDLLDVLIIDEVHGAGSSAAFEQLMRFTGLRVYGMSATPFGRHDKADLAPVALCGPIRLEFDYAFSVRAGANVPMQVYMYKTTGPEGLDRKPDFLRDRLGIYRNLARNAKIACLANSLPTDEQVMIPCRTIEHVLRLHLMLDGYVCVFNSPSPEREEELIGMGLLRPGWKSDPRYMTDPDEARLAFESGEMKKAICTLVWKEGVDFRHLKWIVRADGTANSIFNIQASARPCRRTSDKDVAYIIDFTDDFSGFDWKSRERVKSYRKEGWNVTFVE